MTFDPIFFERDPLLSPIAPAARALRAFDDFPSAAALCALFERAARVRFVDSEPRGRRRRKPRTTGQAVYDARITLDGCVPTRARSWHDLLNALVWATFPRAKRALHARQHRAIAARSGAHARSREMDALAMIDEGGVLLFDDSRQPVVFGHAIYESLVLRRGDPIGAGVVLPRSADPDGALADALRDPDRFVRPEDLPRVPVRMLRDH